jgi:hypothetical protein
MPRLYQITIPGLFVARHWRPVRARLLQAFPEINDVLATTIPATLLVNYSGAPQVDAWLAAVSDAVGHTSTRTAATPHLAGSRSPRPRHRPPHRLAAN